MDAEKANRAAERLTRMTRDSYETAVDHAMAMSERNARFAQGVARDLAGEIRHQAESNRGLAQEMVERAERQRGALKEMMGESLDAYLNLVYAPLSFYKDGLEATGKATAR
jgi:hypothetical protein